MMSLRPYQAEARDAIIREWSEGKQKTLLVLPTGTGKCGHFMCYRCK